jgi:hypothetical protein
MDQLAFQINKGNSAADISYLICNFFSNCTPYKKKKEQKRQRKLEKDTNIPEETSDQPRDVENLLSDREE